MVRRIASVVVVASTAGAACLSRPSALVDATGGDAASAPDAPCVPSTMWNNTPQPIAVTLLGSDDAATSPWLSDSTTDLWFTELTAGDANQPTIMHATWTGSAWTKPQPVAIPTAGLNDNPFVDEAGPTLWWDNRADPSQARTIFEAALSNGQLGGGAVAHGELGAAKEPSLSSDGMHIYFQLDHAGATGLQRADRTGGPGALFGAPVPLIGNADVIESPSVSGDGLSIYFSDYASGEHVAAGALASGSILSIEETEPFEAPAWIYFDPDVSRDGNRLVFAANIGGAAHASLYTITHMCQ